MMDTLYQLVLLWLFHSGYISDGMIVSNKTFWVTDSTLAIPIGRVTFVQTQRLRTWKNTWYVIDHLTDGVVYELIKGNQRKCSAKLIHCESCCS